jgi:hypothetical protein
VYAVAMPGQERCDPTGSSDRPGSNMTGLSGHHKPCEWLLPSRVRDEDAGSSARAGVHKIRSRSRSVDVGDSAGAPR